MKDPYFSSVLCKNVNGEMKAVTFFSKQMNSAQPKYSVLCQNVNGEMKAVTFFSKQMNQQPEKAKVKITVNLRDNIAATSSNIQLANALPTVAAKYAKKRNNSMSAPVRMVRRERKPPDKFDSN